MVADHRQSQPSAVRDAVEDELLVTERGHDVGDIVSADGAVVLSEIDAFVQQSLATGSQRRVRCLRGLGNREARLQDLQCSVVGLGAVEAWRRKSGAPLV